MNKQTLLIDLDALVDTRLGTLSKISSDITAEIMTNGYWDRMRDDFDVLSQNKIDINEYKRLYAERDVETLVNSIMTAALTLIGPMTQELQKRATRGVDVGEIEVLINFAPYKLERELIDEYVEVIRNYLAITCKVSATFLPVAELNPLKLDQVADIWITYAYDEWMTLHNEALLTNRIPMMTILAPALMHNPDKLTKEELTDIRTGEEFNPFKLHQDIMAEFIGIEFHPSFVFSMVH